MNTKLYFRSIMIASLGIFVVGLLLFAISLLPAANVQAAYNIASPITSTIYLPVVFRNYDPTLPRLISPSNGAVLDTLIPTFSWDMGTQPPNTAGCFAISTTPNPTACWMSFGVDFASQWEVVMWFNLQPSTVYYWRVGAVYNFDYANPKWSEERTLTTGPSGGTILPAPVLVSPANNSIVSSPDITVTWQPIAGAVAYSVLFHALDTDRWFSFGDTTDPQLTIWNFASFATEYGNNFEWSVTARNGYAWGDASTSWKFTYSSSGVQMSQPNSIENSTRIWKSGTMIEEIR